MDERKPPLQLYDSEWKRHHAHPKALCRRGEWRTLVKMGVATHAEITQSINASRRCKNRNEFWKALGYPNLKRALAARLENVRRRKLLGVKARDHSVDDLIEACAPTLRPSDFQRRLKSGLATRRSV